MELPNHISLNGRAITTRSVNHTACEPYNRRATLPPDGWQEVPAPASQYRSTVPAPARRFKSLPRSTWTSRSLRTQCCTGPANAVSRCDPTLGASAGESQSLRTGCHWPVGLTGRVGNLAQARTAILADWHCADDWQRAGLAIGAARPAPVVDLSIHFGAGHLHFVRIPLFSVPRLALGAGRRGQPDQLSVAVVDCAAVTVLSARCQAAWRAPAQCHAWFHRGRHRHIGWR